MTNKWQLQIFLDDIIKRDNNFFENNIKYTINRNVCVHENHIHFSLACFFPFTEGISATFAVKLIFAHWKADIIFFVIWKTRGDEKCRQLFK